MIASSIAPSIKVKKAKPASNIANTKPWRNMIVPNIAPNTQAKKIRFVPGIALMMPMPSLTAMLTIARITKPQWHSIAIPAIAPITKARLLINVEMSIAKNMAAICPIAAAKAKNAKWNSINNPALA